jgi:hypothetical protein
MHQPGYERAGGRNARDERTKAAPHAHSTRRGSVRAAIDVGSNSVHMLVAPVDGDSIVELGDRSMYARGDSYPRLGDSSRRVCV